MNEPVAGKQDVTFAQLPGQTKLFLETHLYIATGSTFPGDFKRSMQHRSSLKMTWRVYGIEAEDETDGRAAC